MSLIDKIKSMLNNNKNNEYKKLNQGISTIQNVYAESDSQKEAVENAKNAVIKEIQSHKDMPVGEFLRLVKERTELTDGDLVEIIKQMPNVKSEEATIEAVEKLELPSEAITEIIQDTSVSPVTAQKIAEQIPDKEIQRKQKAEIERMLEAEQKAMTLAKEEKVLSQLSEIYNNCEHTNDVELAEIISGLEISEKTEKMDTILKHIIAKKVALDCMQFGGPKLPTMTRIISAADMLKANLPLLAEIEYQKIKPKFDEQGKTYHPFDEQEQHIVKLKLLENIAKKVARDFEEIGDITVPQIEQLKNLSEEDLNVFVNTIKNSCHNEQLSEDDVTRIKKQLNGETIYELKDLNRMLEKMNSKDREIAVSDFVKSLRSRLNENRQETQNDLDNILSNIDISIRNLPNEKRLSTAKVILDTLYQQQEAINMWEKRNKKSDERIKGEDR